MVFTAMVAILTVKNIRGGKIKKATSRNPEKMGRTLVLIRNCSVRKNPGKGTFPLVVLVT